jgi:hypothetical protein
MRKWKLAAAATVASGVLAAGMFAAFSLTAKAGTISADGCTASGNGSETTALTCNADDDGSVNPAIAFPLSITVTGETTPSSLPVTFVWSAQCTEPSDAVVTTADTTEKETPASGASATFTVNDADMNNVIDPTACNFDVTATITGDSADTATALDVGISVDQSAAATPTATTASPTPSASTSTASTSTTTTYTNQVHGFDGTCLDDKGNSSSKRAEVIIWSCSDTDQAQAWTYSGSELKIHGMCLNAKGNGKSGSKLILWSCSSSGNEIFSHRSDGEFAEKANGYKLCIDDPGYSTKNGTQPFMYKCNNGANQHWSKP